MKQVTRDIITQLQTDPEAFWHSIMMSIVDFGLRLLVALLIYVVGIWLIGWVKRGMKKAFAKRNTEPTLASFLSSFVSISLTVLLVVISVSTVGVDTTSLAALLAAGGMAIGMALSGTVQNFAGGLMLLAFKPFKAGDFIEAQGVSGTVVEVNITATKVLTTDNRVVILPNGSLSNGVINNITGRPLRRVEWEVSVEYGIDAEACKQTIIELLNRDERVLQADTNMDEFYKSLNISKFQLASVGYKMDAIPAPFVALKSLNASDITFVVRCWTKSTDYWGLFFDMQQVFYTELPKHGFGFAYPHVQIVNNEE
jgi:small conductance mechanosensitive channel